MDPATIILILAVVFGFYMAWNIGANDVANAMGTSVGSHALTIKQAVIVAAIFEFSGAFLVGGNVTNTIRKGIIDPSLFEAEPMTLALGLLAALLASALWLQFASLRGLPVSTTHSIVGSMIGFSIVSMGISSVNYSKVLGIIASWFVSPLCGGILGYLSFITIRRLILDKQRPVEATKKYAPWLMSFVGFVLGLVLFFKGLKHIHLEISMPQTLGISAFMGLSFALFTVYMLRDLEEEDNSERSTKHARVEKVFAWMQIVTACFMAFAHGSNDVANAIAPLAGIVGIVKTGMIATQSTVPLWTLTLGGVGIVIGLATYGAKVIATVGKSITEMTPTRGFAAEFGAALTILVGSRLGLPLSTTHILVGAVIGVGFARGMAALNLRILKQIATSWLVTVPVAAVLSAVIFLILQNLFSF